MTLENDASFVESGKKESKKRKRDKQENEHFSDAVNMSMGDEKIKKKQKKYEIHQDVGDGGVCKEALDTTLNPDHREEKKKNKKHRKLKALEDKSLPSSDHVDTTLEGNDTRDSKIHKPRKEKKKDECKIEIEDGKNKTEKMKKDKKQSKEKDNGGRKGEKEVNDQDGDSSKESEKKRKRKKKMMKKDFSATEDVNVTEQVEKQPIMGKDDGGHKGEKEANDQDGDSSKESEKKKRKREKKMMKKDFSATEDVNVTEQVEKQPIMGKDDGGHKGEKEANDQDGDSSKESEKKKRKREKKMMKKDLSATESVNNGVTEQVEKQSRKKKAVEEVKKKKKRSKKVTFSSEVKVFPLDHDDLPKKKHGEKLIQGKRFTPEENEKIKEAVNNYIIDHNLGENGLDMIMHCRQYPKIKSCWKEIGLALPHRPSDAVYYRAHIIFERDENSKWSEEDLDLVRDFHAKHGPKWKLLAELTGRHRVHIKDTWRRVKFPNKKAGQWSQDEYQNLFDLVNCDLKLKVFAEKKSKHGMLRDNIGWTAISEMLTTRTDATCCIKWYEQLSSSMVREGVWADTDDYRLLGMLYNLDACSVEEVDWDNLIEVRTGDLCRRRWNQMVRHICNYKTKSFPEQVEILSQRYKLDVLEAREIWDNKPYDSDS